MRTLDLDCGPMSGFDTVMVDAVCFPRGMARSNFLRKPGYGDPAKFYARAPNLSFDEASTIARAHRSTTR